MNTADKQDVWTGPQLAARLLAMKGVAPEAVRYVVFRETAAPNGARQSGYCIPGSRERLNERQFVDWLADQGVAGADRLGVAILAIQETLDEAGQLRECALERRRGSVNGPFCGDPARIEFTGPAGMVRLYRGLRNGRLQEIAASSEPGPPIQRAANAFAGEADALRERFGDGMEVVDLREPTLFEEVAGLSAIAHLRLPDGRETAAAIGWFGPLAFVLEAAFPRFGMPPELTPEDAAAVDRLLHSDRLVRHEIRLDECGLAVMARRRGGLELFQIRVEGGAARSAPYDPRPEAAAGKDQIRWMRYAKKAESLTVLDAWRESPDEELLVLTGDPKGLVWRHAIDADGVEAWRRPDDSAAAAILHRERLFPGAVLAAETVPPPKASFQPVHDAPAADTLLARLRTYDATASAFDQVRRSAAGGDTTEVDAAVRRLDRALREMGAPVAASATIALTRSGNRDDLAEALAEIEARLDAELALVRLSPVAELGWLPGEDDAPFGQTIADVFPSAAYDIEEAVRCLSLRRPTAAMLHATRALQAGLDALAKLAAAESPADWTAAAAVLRRAEVQPAGTAAALDTVRRRWRSSRLEAAAKYTEEEAGQALKALAGFFQVAAAAGGVAA